MRTPALLLAAALLTACGSTAQLTAPAGQELGAPTDALGQPAGGPASTPVTDLGGPAPATVGGGAGTPVTAPSARGAAPVTSAGAGGGAPTATGRITTPVQVGFMTTNVGNAQSAGLNVGATYSDKQVYDALVKEYNKAGGLAGRRILPVYGETDTASTDWNTQFQAACEHLTQDNKVQAVLGYVFVFLDSFEQCLASKNIPHLYGGYNPGDIQAQRDYPGLVSVAHPTVDVLNKTVVTGAVASGRLTTRSKLGIIYDGCGHGERAFTTSTEPLLKQLKLSYQAVFLACSTGSGDAGSALATVKSAQLQFAAAGVDVVYISNTIALLFFMQYAESQGYRPQYVNQGGGASLEAQGGAAPQEQLKNLHGFGWAPAVDVGPGKQPYKPTPAQAACLAKLRSQGLQPQQFNDFMFAYVTCDSLDLYARALELTGGRTGRAEVRAALERLLPATKGAFTYDGVFDVSPVQRGGPARYRESGWATACSCFTYTGPVRAVPRS